MNKTDRDLLSRPASFAMHGGTFIEDTNATKGTFYGILNYGDTTATISNIVLGSGYNGTGPTSIAPGVFLPIRFSSITLSAGKVFCPIRRG